MIVSHVSAPVKCNGKFLTIIIYVYVYMYMYPRIRMDRVVSLELPDISLRLTHIVRCSKELLSFYMDEKSQNQLDLLCAHGNILLTDSTEQAFSDAIGSIVVGVDVTALLKEGTTEQPDKPVSTPVKRRGRPRKVVATPVPETEPITDVRKEGSTEALLLNPMPFNLLRCLYHLAECSAGWSHRELAKVMQNIQSEVIATEE